MPNEASLLYDFDTSNYLKFPLEQTDILKSKIVFEPYEVIASTFSFSKSVGTDTNAGRSFPKKEGSFKSSGGIKLNKLNERTELFLPLQFAVRDGIQYTDASLGLFGGQAFNTVASGGSLNAGIVETIQGFGDSLVGLFDTLSGRQQLGAVAAARAAQLPAVPQVARDIIGLAGRVTINPNVRTAFNGVTTRDFLFQFDFYPKSEEESEELYNIIKRFRINAYPDRVPGSGFVPVA